MTHKIFFPILVIWVVGALHSSGYFPYIPDQAPLNYLAIGVEFAGRHMRVFGAATLFLLVMVEFPVWFIKWRIKRGDPLAGRFDRAVQQTGLVSLVLYWHQNRGRGNALAEEQGVILRPDKKQKRRSKRLQAPADVRTGQAPGDPECPDCGADLKNLGDYRQNLDFHHCPKCGRTLAMPAWTFQDYIGQILDQLEQAAASKKRFGRKKAKNGSDANEMGLLLQALYCFALESRSSDIHMERTSQGGDIQFRIDGVMTDMFHLAARTATALASAIKVQAHLDITNHMTPQDGRFMVEVAGRQVDMRVNCAPTSSSGEVIFIRLLDKRNIEIAPGELGLEGKDLQLFEQAIQRPHGLVLVTGPTGSGKSTTIYVAMNQINTRERNIITIEDPVEYQLSGLKQMQVNPDKNFTFATGLRSILRQDPDVILVGEIRDTETANMSIEAADTGHLVFTTLHTMHTAAAVTRLADLGVPTKRYAHALELIIAQRLVRLLCQNCREVVAITTEQMEQLRIRRVGQGHAFYRGSGCDACNQTGYFGRQAIFEILKPDSGLRTLLEAETRAGVIREYSRKQLKMLTLRKKAVLKAMAGETSIEEILRQVV